jgi:hypothetical protein
VDGENHVAGMIADADIGVRGNVIEELMACFCDSLGAVGLPCCDRAEGGE